ncbi:hypothetical protein A6U85_17740 [Agrobacterium sp. 13-626]|nr:hypothetical protein CN09_28565 [Rhizobium rhizogenes]OCI94762.1 hypothetical protein A6U85_17740 [Agrobacterium sp. 13-626]OCJ08758.1 hypothetical protein A6U88_23430 [Agrobacterium sp. B131/95]OCJ14146.1 hypothetical protein A6U89_23235 [Agrobacterium sp. B133/95]
MRIFGYLAKQILAVYWLQTSVSQPFEVELQTFECRYLPVGYLINYVFSGWSACIDEVFRYTTVKCTWASYDKVRLVEVEHG